MPRRQLLGIPENMNCLPKSHMALVVVAFLTSRDICWCGKHSRHFGLFPTV